MESWEQELLGSALLQAVLAGTAVEEVARDIIVRAAADIAKALNPEAVQVESIPIKRNE